MEHVHAHYHPEEYPSACDSDGYLANELEEL